MTKIAGSGSASGSISQRYGSADPDPDPDPPQNVMDPQHWLLASLPPLFLLTLFLLPLLTSLESLLWLGSLLLLASPTVVGVPLYSSCLLAVGVAVNVCLPLLFLLWISWYGWSLQG
jgi:hypothetical protein